MFLHGEVAARKPHPRHLTSFYLSIAAGGAIGGLLVGLVAPSLLRVQAELPLTAAVCRAALLLYEFRSPALQRFAWLALLLSVCACAGSYLHELLSGNLAADRNFYGSLRVKDETDESRIMVHGTINHGSQWLDDDLRHEATTYFAAGSGVHWAIDQTRRTGQRVGIIGLGTGTIAAWARPGRRVPVLRDQSTGRGAGPQVVHLPERL